MARTPRETPVDLAGDLKRTGSDSLESGDQFVVYRELFDHRPAVRRVSMSAVPTVMAITIDGGGNAIVAGAVGDYEIPFNATITRASAYADTTGGITVDFRTSTPATYPTFASICGGQPLVIDADDSVVADISAWDVDLSAGSILRPVTSGISSIGRLTINITLVRA